MNQKVKVAAAHVAPVYMDARATAGKAARIIREAGADGIQFIVFPESFVPGFPLWPALSAPIYNHDLFSLFARQSVHVPGPEVLSICSAARDAGVMVSIGISEASDRSVGCLWNTNLLIGTDGAIINHHRKIVPTFFEKLIWANGDGNGLRVVKTPIGKIGALICGENTNPLARFSLIAQGEQIHASSYPPTWPTHDPRANDRYDLASAIRIRAGAHSFEAKAFNVVASSRIDQSMLDQLAGLGQDALSVILNSPQGLSVIIGPDGMPLTETQATEDVILTQVIDLDALVVPKQFHDLVGYYNRFDIFHLEVNRAAMNGVNFSGDEIPPRGLEFEEMERMMDEASKAGTN